MTDVECIVIGAGVIGLAVARALALQGREVVILERERHFGAQISSRNSEVIHGGLYYPAGSLKAQLCVEGRHLLYDYCERRAIPHRRCGKLIIATSSDQLTDVQQIAATARNNGVMDLQWMDAEQARRLEPHLTCVAALHSPATGIIDSHAYFLALIADAEGCGASFAYGADVTSLHPTTDGIEISIAPDAAPVVRSQVVVNAAGLHAGEVCARIRDFPAERIPRTWLAKGSYFALAGRCPFNHLIYPVPEAGGLGIHLTIDLTGQGRFGPDVEWTEHIDYDVDQNRSRQFYAAIRRYWPQLKEGQLQPAYAGIRPKLSGPGEPAQDFCISGPEQHGVAGIFSLFGIESPGLTASLALADRVALQARAHT